MHLTEGWRLKGPRYMLVGSRDKRTGEVYYPPRQVTPGEREVYEFVSEKDELGSVVIKVEGDRRTVVVAGEVEETVFEGELFAK